VKSVGTCVKQSSMPAKSLYPPDEKRWVQLAADGLHDMRGAKAALIPEVYVWSVNLDAGGKVGPSMRRINLKHQDAKRLSRGPKHQCIALVEPKGTMLDFPFE
jgi:hypothetical protein